MELRVIKNKSGHKRALRRLRALMDLNPGPGASEIHELEVLALLINDYEEKAFPISRPSPIEAIKFRMEQARLKRADLIPLLGSAGKVSEVLSGKRPLSKRMMLALHEGLGIPLEALFSRTRPTTVKPRKSKGKTNSRSAPRRAA